MRNRFINVLLWLVIISRMVIGGKINVGPTPPRGDLEVVYLEQPLDGCETIMTNDTLILHDRITPLKLMINTKFKSNVQLNTNNHITGLKYGIFESIRALRCLNLSDNAIKPEELLSFGPVPNLKKLFLAHQRVPFESHLRTLGPSDFQLPTLEYLNVRNISINTLPAEFLQMLPNIHYLDLSDNLLNISEWTEFISEQLITLHLERIGARMLSFRDLKNVQVLYLDGNHFETIGQHHSPSFLDFQNATQLKVLSLKNCSITIIDLDAFYLSPQLQSLDLSFNRIKGLDPRIYDLTSLESLSLSHNQLRTFDSGDSGVALKHLSLSYNDLDAVPRDLKRLANLEKLSLRGNRISIVHSHAFRGLSSLRELDLAENQIKKFLCNLSRNLPELRMLNVESNRLSHKHHILDRNSQVKELFMGNNNFRKIKNESFWNLPDELIVYV